MKSSNAGTTVASTSGRRAQPIRQTRTNPPRASATTSRPLAGGRTLGAATVEIGPAATSPPGFFPAIQYFTDAITELPKETIRHLTLFKEVDAKSCGPEERLIQLVEAAINTPVPRKTNPTIQHPPTTATVGNIDHLDENGTLRNATGLADNDEQVSEPPVPVPYAPTPEETARRQIFEQLHHIASEIMMPTLDEKIHVLSPAREALNKQLTRLDSVFPHVEGEISEEARYGSLTHWAYIEKANARPNGASDRQRRDVGGANSLAAAAAALNDSEVAIRSEMRREAVQARRNRTQHVDSDFDDPRNGRQNSAQPGANKKSHGNTKVKRTIDAPSSSTVGLGISNGVPSTSANPPHKRRKTEKTTNNGNGVVAMERSISSAFGGGSGAKGNARSPRETPTAEGPKKRSRAPATSGTRKRNNTTTSTGQSPSIASSPVHGTFGISKDAFRNSPAPATSQRPTSSRARQNSAQSMAQEVNGRPKASYSTSAKTNGINGVLSNNTTNHATGAATRSPTKPSHHEGLSDDPRKPGDSNKNTPGSDTKTSDGAFKKEDNDSVQGIEPTTTTVTTTRTGRTSKTSTPTHASFPPSFPRSRPSRTDSYTANSAIIKRSHKKGAGAAAQAAQAAQLQRITDPSGSHAAGRTGDDSSLQGDQDGDDEGEEDEDEPRYCYCNGVSYGEMVACDNDDCPREWFHLSCVGLKKPPSSSAWYCDDCSKTLKKNGKGTVAVR